MATRLPKFTQFVSISFNYIYFIDQRLLALSVLFNLCMVKMPWLFDRKCHGTFNTPGIAMTVVEGSFCQTLGLFLRHGLLLT